MAINPGAAGTAYFTDGHTEPIINYRYVNEGVQFTTAKGDRYFCGYRIGLIQNDLSLLGYSCYREPYFMKLELVYHENLYLDGTVTHEVYWKHPIIDYIEKIVLCDI